MQRPVPERVTTAAFAVTVVLGALNNIAVKVSDHDLAPFWGAALRFGLASALSFGLVAARHVRLPRDRALVGSAVYGLLVFGLGFSSLYWGLVEAPAGLSVVILATTPLFTILFAAAQGVEPFRWQGLVGAVVSLAGIAVIFGDQLGAAVPLASMLAIMIGAACFAEANVVIKRFPQTDPIARNAVAMSAGAAVLLVITLATGSPIAAPVTAATWLALGYLVAIGSVVLFGLFLYVIARWTASATSYQLLLMPLVGVPVASILLHEPLRPTFLVGGAIVLAGVYLGAFAPALAHRLPAIPIARPATAGGPGVDERTGPPDCASGCP